MEVLVLTVGGKMSEQNPSTSAPQPLCCEYHEEKKHKASEAFIHLPTIHELRKQSLVSHWGEVLYIILAALLLLAALAEVIVTGGSFILTKNLDAEITGRVVGVVLLTICAAVCFLSVSYAVYAVSKKNHAALYVVSAVIAVMVIIQILLVVFAVTMKKSDTVTLETILSDSFVQANSQKDEASLRMWDSLQSLSKCCGLNGPEDYVDPATPYLPAKIPVSCCPVFQNESQFFTKWHRDLCIINKSYYTEGCSESVVALLKITVRYVSIFTLVFIVFEVLISAIGFYLVKKSSSSSLSTNNWPHQPVTSQALTSPEYLKTIS